MRKELLRLESINKSDILRCFRMNLFEGEILVLAGLTGSGISAVADILEGAANIDSGYLWFDERRVSRDWFKTTRHNSIFRAHATCSLIENMSVAENIFVIHGQTRPGAIINRNEINLLTQSVLDELAINIRLDEAVGNLRQEEQRMIELVKAVVFGARLIILEDVWGGYTKAARDALFSLIRKLQNAGNTFLILTHRHEDIVELMDRMVLVRDGRDVMVLDQNEYQRELVYRTLIGYDFYLPSDPYSNRAHAVDLKKELLRVKNLSGKHLDDLSFSVSSGEVLSILDTQEVYANELSDILINGLPHTGEILLGGKQFFPCDRLTAMRNGVGVIGSRAHKMLCDNLTWPENLALMYKLRYNPPNPVMTSRLVQVLISEFGGELEGLDPAKPLCDTDAGSYIRLKLAYLKWIIYRPKLLICVKPFSSGDVLMREVAVSMIRRVASKGIGVLVISTNPKEAWVCCDRIGIITRGKVSNTMSQADFTRVMSDN